MARLGFALHPRLGFCEFEGVRGVAATGGAIAVGETLFRVPVEALLGPASLHSIAGRLRLCRGIRDCWVRVILALMAERAAGSRSFWAPFIAVLPQLQQEQSGPSALRTPLYWTEADRAELRGTETLARLGRTEIEEQWRTIAEPVVRTHPDVFAAEDGSLPGLADFVHWGSCVLSRAFEAHPSYKGPVMVPMADALNHRTGRCNAHLELHDDDGAKALPMLAISNVPEGAELINTYGDHGNGELLRRYGFTDAENPFDEVCVPVQFMLTPKGSSSSNYDRRCERMRLKQLVAAGVVPCDEFTLHKKDTALPATMLCAARALCMTPKEFRIAKARRGGLARLRVAQPSLTAAEKARISGAIARRLQQYPTTLEEDERLLASALQHQQQQLNHLDALRVRVGEKRILQGLLMQL